MNVALQVRVKSPIIIDNLYTSALLPFIVFLLLWQLLTKSRGKLPGLVGSTHFLLPSSILEPKILHLRGSMGMALPCLTPYTVCIYG